jgi:PhzF family phenazine biosynthesis protein
MFPVFTGRRLYRYGIELDHVLMFWLYLNIFTTNFFIVKGAQNMKPQKIYQVDAFSNGLFTGNPAAVCILNEEWLPESLMQKIAMENNLAETAFVLNSATDRQIRWFTPTVEVDLCGHATLASAHVLFTHEGQTGNTIRFGSRSGILTVTKDNEILSLDFPTDELRKAAASEELLQCFDLDPVEVWRGKTDYMFVFGREDQIVTIQPDMAAIARVPARGIIITAPGDSVDFVSRFFGPQSGVPEDPVTGSAHTTLTPYWSGRLGKNELSAMQLSSRKGWLKCRHEGDRTVISGKAVTYMMGELMTHTGFLTPGFNPVTMQEFTL